MGNLTGGKVKPKLVACDFCPEKIAEKDLAKHNETHRRAQKYLTELATQYKTAQHDYDKLILHIQHRIRPILVNTSSWKRNVKICFGILALLSAFFIIMRLWITGFAIFLFLCTLISCIAERMYRYYFQRELKHFKNDVDARTRSVQNLLGCLKPDQLKNNDLTMNSPLRRHDVPSHIPNFPPGPTCADLHTRLSQLVYNPFDSVRHALEFRASDGAGTSQPSALTDAKSKDFIDACCLVISFVALCKDPLKYLMGRLDMVPVWVITRITEWMPVVGAVGLAVYHCSVIYHEYGHSHRAFLTTVDDLHHNLKKNWPLTW
jgi:hypothetical protein